MQEEFKKRLEEMSHMYYMTCSECGHSHMETDIMITAGAECVFCDCGNILIPESFLLKHKDSILMSIDDEVFKSIKLKNKEKYVYVLNCDGNYKIGISENVKKRIKQIQIGNSAYINEIMSYKFEASIASFIENYFHKHFTDKNVNSEWFELQEKEIDYIRERLDKAQRLNAQLITAGLKFEERENIIRSNFKRY